MEVIIYGDHLGAALKAAIYVLSSSYKASEVMLVVNYSKKEYELRARSTSRVLAIFSF